MLAFRDFAIPYVRSLDLLHFTNMTYDGDNVVVYNRRARARGAASNTYARQGRSMD